MFYLNLSKYLRCYEVIFAKAMKLLNIMVKLARTLLFKFSSRSYTVTHIHLYLGVIICGYLGYAHGVVIYKFHLCKTRINQFRGTGRFGVCR